jgi:hypothetical protein
MNADFHSSSSVMSRALGRSERGRGRIASVTWSRYLDGSRECSTQLDEHC